MSSNQLQAYFKFDDADLMANRMGQLTPKQIERLTQEVKASRGCGLISGVGLMLIALLPATIVLLTGAVQQMGVIFLLPWVLIWLPIWGLIGFSMIRGAFKKHVVTLQKVEGPINIVKSVSTSTDSDGHTSTSVSYDLHVGGKKFDVNSHLADFMMQGDTYTIYYVTDLEKIMSVEFRAKA
jgi:hypothetical protein